MNLFMQLSPDMLAQMPESHRLIVESRPGWATFAFALSVISGVLGAFALLFRHRIAGPLFFLSFLGAVITTAQAVIGGGALQKFGSVEIVLGVIGPIAFGFFLVWFAHVSRKRGWLHGRSAKALQSQA